VLGALVAGALAIGVLAGASLAPAPPSSLASGSTVVTRLLALLAAQAQGGAHASAPPTSAPLATPALAAVARPTKPASNGGSEASSASSSPSEADENTSSESSPPGGSGKGEKKPIKLPPISHVWLIVLSGPGFAGASLQPAAYPYLTGHLLGQGTLLERYSAIEGYELAGDAALLTGAVGESVSTISEPGCQAPPTAVGPPDTSTTGAAPCPGNTGTQTEADSFLQRVLTPILTSSAYAEHGLIVLTFGNASQEAGLTATTLAAQPPTGALLLSPTLKAGAHSSEAFNSLAPRESLEAIFGHS
jgi:hypothetical protein